MPEWGQGTCFVWAPSSQICWRVGVWSTLASVPLKVLCSLSFWKLFWFDIEFHVNSSSTLSVPGSHCLPVWMVPHGHPALNVTVFPLCLMCLLTLPDSKVFSSSQPSTYSVMNCLTVVVLLVGHYSSWRVFLGHCCMSWVIIKDLSLLLVRRCVTPRPGTHRLLLDLCHICEISSYTCYSCLSIQQSSGNSCAEFCNILFSV